MRGRVTRARRRSVTRSHGRQRLAHEPYRKRSIDDLKLLEIFIVHELEEFLKPVVRAEVLLSRAGDGYLPGLRRGNLGEDRDRGHHRVPRDARNR